jgi:hypothetical protein
VQLPITIGLHRSRILDVLIFLFALIGSGANLAFSIKPLIQFRIADTGMGGFRPGLATVINASIPASVGEKWGNRPVASG